MHLVLVYASVQTHSLSAPHMLKTRPVTEHFRQLCACAWSHIQSMDCILNHLIIPIIDLDKVTTMMANTMLAMTLAMTTAKMMKIQICANAIIHGDVLATMETTTMN